MNRKHGTWLVLSVVPMLLLCTAGCSGQKTEDAQVMDEAPPPASDASVAGTTAPEPPPVQAEPSHPQRTRSNPPATGTIPEERPRQSAPPQPQAVNVTIPSGTTLAVTFGEMVTSETAQVTT